MAKGFQKILLNKPSSFSFPKKRSFKIFKLLGLFFLGLIVLLVLVGVVVLIPGKDLYLALQKTGKTSSEAYTAIKNQDIEMAQVKLTELGNDLTNCEKHLSRLSFLKYIPLLGVYEKDAEHLMKAGMGGVEAAKIAVETLIPYGDLLGLKGKSTFVAGSADERIKTAVETLDKIIPNIDRIAEKIAVVGSELDQVDFQRYPEKIGSVTVRSRLKTGKEFFSQTATLFVDAQPLLEKLPDLLGVKDQRRYLVLFQNDAELRATGGFITAYALFKVDKGKLQVEKADDIYRLDEAKKKKFPAPNSILRYHKNVYTLELRDSNLSPDFAASMKEFEKMLKESVGDFPEFNGIIALDTHVLVSMIKILGDFNVYGRNFSAENDKRCDCPKAIYELEDYATRPVAYVREDRKDIIGVLMYQMMQRALGVSPSEYWGKLFQMFLEEARQKHTLFYFHDPDAQKGIESLGFGGKIEVSNGDYLHVNDVNFAGAKSNMFVKQSVKQEIDIDSDGVVKKTLTISYKNPSPPSNCNLEAGELCLNGILRNWLRIYVPSGSTLLSFTGSEKDTASYDEFGKTVFEGFLTVKPQGASEVKVVYKLPLKLKKGDKYTLLIQKQPGTDNNNYQIINQGREVEKFELLNDKEISFKL